MREYVLIAPEFIFGDYLGKSSPQATLYYIKLLCYANKGFVSNPIEILDGMGYDKSVYDELVANECILTLPNRSEVFITSYYIHNRGLKYNETFKSYYWIYWKGKLWFKENGMATRKMQESAIYDPKKDRSKQPKEEKSFDDIIEDLDNEKIEN